MNSGDKPSSYLSEYQTRNVFNAAAYAFCSGQKLNRFVTVQCARSHLTHAETHAFTTSLTKYYADWLRTHSGSSPIRVWLLENKSGIHLHLLLHVPPYLVNAFTRHNQRWVNLSGVAPSRGVAKCKPIYFSDPSDSDADYLQQGLLGLVQYLCKATEPSACTKFGIDHQPQGIICGKRASWSQALGKGCKSWLLPALQGKRVLGGNAPLQRLRLLRSVGYPLF